MGASPLSHTLPHNTFLGIIWGGTAIGTIALAFRLYVRYNFFRTLVAEDYLVTFAYVLLLTSAILWQNIITDMYELFGVEMGMQQPGPRTEANAEKYLRGQMAFVIMFYTALWSIKASFLVFFYRLGKHIPAYRILWWTTAIATFIAGAATFGVIPYSCSLGSLEGISKRCLKPSMMRRESVHNGVDFALDIVTDVMIMVLPFVIVWKVQISPRKKLALAGLFSLGLLTIAVAIVRVSSYGDNGKFTVLRGSKHSDLPWLNMWSFIEFVVAILVACLGAFRSLFVQREREAERREKQQRHTQRRVRHIKRLWTTTTKTSYDNGSALSILEAQPISGRRSPTRSQEDQRLEFITSKLDMDQHTGIVRRDEYDVLFSDASSLTRPATVITSSRGEGSRQYSGRS